MKKILLSLLFCVLCGVVVYFATRNCGEECNNASQTVSEQVDGTAQAPVRKKAKRVRELTDHLDNLADLSGVRTGLGESDGRYLLIHFWNLKDTSYLTTLPDFQKLKEETPQKNTRMLSVFCYEGGNTASIEEAKQILAEGKMDFPLYTLSSDDPGYQALGIDDYYQLFLVNPKNRIIFEGPVKDYKIRFESDMAKIKK